MGFHGIRQVLLVGEDEDDGVPHLPVVNDAVELLAGLVDAVAIGAVHHKDQPLRARVVVPPEGTDLVLAPDIPHVELDVFVSNRLHVEAHGGDGGDRLAQLQFVQDGGFTSRVQTQHQDPHLLVAEDLGQHLAHLGGIQGARRLRGGVRGSGGRAARAGRGRGGGGEAEAERGRVSGEGQAALSAGRAWGGCGRSGTGGWSGGGVVRRGLAGREEGPRRAPLLRRA